MLKSSSLLDWTNIIILTINGIVIYLSFYRSKNKEFEKHLFDKKLKAYEEINIESSKLLSLIDTQSSPFTEVYDLNSKEEWEDHYENNIQNMVGIGISYFEEVESKYGLIISSKVLSSLYDYTFLITRFIVESYHYDTEVIIDKYDRSSDLLDELKQVMRKDLKIEEIDKSLRNRLKAKFK